jgi:hypothetical protein
LTYSPSQERAEAVANLVLIEQAVQQSIYHPDHIRLLVRQGTVKGEKHGGIWLIDLDSLRAYEARMREKGTQKHTPTKYRRGSKF